MKIGFAGLGVMGGPMARHLVHAGHEVAGFNRSIEKAATWAELTGGTVAETIEAAADGAEIFILCVGNDDDVRQVVSQALPHLQPGAVIVDHTTTSAVVAREMSDAASVTGRHFIDAPVSGGQAGAESGQLSVMAGGNDKALARVEPVLKAYSKAIKHMGPSGSGQLAKMVNQIAIAGVVQGLAEAVHFAQSAGLDTDAVYDAISKGAAQSWQMDEARANGARLDMTTLVDGYYAEVQALGGSRWDTSSLAARLQKT